MQSKDNELLEDGDLKEISKEEPIEEIQVEPVLENGFLGGGVAELTKVRKAVVSTNEKVVAAHMEEANVSAKEKDIANQKRYVEDKIASTVKERRAELKKSHDENIEEADKALKDAEKARKIAKAEAVENRVKQETAAPTQAISDLKKEAKKIFKEHRMPSFCASHFYYSLFAPKKPLEFLTFVITLLIALGAIPVVVCLFLIQSTWFVRLLIYLAIVAFFVIIYVLVYMMTKSNGKDKIIDSTREYIDKISNKKSNIKDITKNIRKDQDESRYDLEKFDNAITSAKENLDKLNQEKEDALKQFDEETAQNIRDEITKENEAVINDMESEYESMKESLKNKVKAAKLAEKNLANNYSVYLGKKNMTPEKIDELIAIIEKGEATTISKALMVQSGEIK